MKPFDIAILLIRVSSIIYAESAFSAQQTATPHYEPLYVVYSSGKFDFPEYLVRYSSSNELVLTTPGYDVLVACPMENREDRLLEFVNPQTRTMVLDSSMYCKRPVLPVTQKFQHFDTYMIGYKIYKRDGNSWIANPYYELLPQTDYPLLLIQVTYKKSPTSPRSLITRHTIKYGRRLPVDYIEPQTLRPYEPNNDIYGFFIDPAYSPDNQKYIFETHFNQSPPSALIKVQLTPEADYYFENFKVAARSNINTTPMWQVLLPQWRQLEKFIRKIALVLDELDIITGASHTYTIPKPNGYEKPLYLYQDTDLPVYKFIWKAVSLRQKYEGKFFRYGIVFVMHNDPQTINQPVICTKDISHDMGWTILENGQKFLSPMYACPMTKKILELLQTYTPYEYQDFNLRKLRLSSDIGPGSEMTVDVDVIKEFEKLSLNAPSPP